MPTLPDVVAERDVAAVKTKMQAAFGMQVSDAFALALIAFVDATNARIAELEAQRGGRTHGHPRG